MTILRAGLYERVSTEEQAKFGYSVRAQVEALNEYCEKNKLKVVDHYTDEGVSGGKPIEKRPELMRLIEDVKAGKVDIILFTKLDRWSRNTKEFFKAQDILDKLKVEWKAIHEDYDTTTANGRMAITIFLAIAQNEREKTSERIKVVFENKRKNKEAWFGWKSMPFGYMKQEDENGVPRLVKNPELQDAVQEFFDMTLKLNNSEAAMRHINATYGLNRTKTMWNATLHKEIYTGTYRGVEGFCEPYVSKEDFKKLQVKKVQRKTKKNRVYLFTGLLVCPGCAHTLKSTYIKGKLRDYFAYRCNYKDLRQCEYRHNIHEMSLEKALLAELEGIVKQKIEEIENERAKPRKKPANNLKALKEQLRRLEIVYMAGNKSDDDYIAESNDIKKKIKAAEEALASDPAEVDVSGLKAFLQSDWRALYDDYTREEKQAFWRGILKEVHFDGKKIKAVELNF